MEEFQWERLEDTHLGREGGQHLGALLGEESENCPNPHWEPGHGGLWAQVSCSESKHNTLSGELLPKAEVVAALDPSGPVQAPLWNEAMWTPSLRRTFNTHLVCPVSIGTKPARQKSWCLAQFIGGNSDIWGSSRGAEWELWVSYSRVGDSECVTQVNVSLHDLKLSRFYLVWSF